jgi:hypothetical protein
VPILEITDIIERFTLSAKLTVPILLMTLATERTAVAVTDTVAKVTAETWNVNDELIINETLDIRTFTPERDKVVGTIIVMDAIAITNASKERAEEPWRLMNPLVVPMPEIVSVDAAIRLNVKFEMITEERESTALIDKLEVPKLVLLADVVKIGLMARGTELIIDLIPVRNKMVVDERVMEETWMITPDTFKLRVSTSGTN